MSRFDYVKYDETSVAQQARLKEAAIKVEKALQAVEEARLEMLTEIDNLAEDPDLPEASLKRATEKLNEATGPDIDDALMLAEESYMWGGKAIRDAQIKRNDGAELQEGRSDG